jgi:hypothetical protein
MDTCSGMPRFGLDFQLNTTAAKVKTKEKNTVTELLE